MGEGVIVDLMDSEYAIPGELEAHVPAQRRVEAWPERAQRRIEALEGRIRHLEAMVHRLVNGAGQE